MFKYDKVVNILLFLVLLLLLGVELGDGSDGLLHQDGLPWPGAGGQGCGSLLPALEEPHDGGAVVVPLQQVEAAVVILPEAVPVPHGAAGAGGADAVVINENLYRGLLGGLLPLFGSPDHCGCQADWLQPGALAGGGRHRGHRVGGGGGGGGGLSPGARC